LEDFSEVWFLLFAQTNGAAPAPGAPGSTGGELMKMLPLLLVFAAVMLFFARPNKQQRERQQQLSKLAKGDRVVTIGGICGTIVGLSEKTVVLRVSDEPAVKMEFVRKAIYSTVTKDDETDGKSEKDKK
jgi:preprotein translocase subunit YajC